MTTLTKILPQSILTDEKRGVQMSGIDLETRITLVKRIKALGTPNMAVF